MYSQLSYFSNLNYFNYIYIYILDYKKSKIIKITNSFMLYE